MLSVTIINLLCISIWIFLLGIVRMRGGALHMGKGRSNNAGKKQPNFNDSSNFAKQSQPTEKKKK